ncbi:GPW/gp25 family protein, partial [Xanthomonas campestris]
MIGIDATTGRVVQGGPHLAQSIACILTTPVGTRGHRRGFGSPLPGLLGPPVNGATRPPRYGAPATAPVRWGASPPA